MSHRNQYGLLLSGGGARAAYQVGVLKAITAFLPRNQGLPFPIISGTSAGAINATCLGCYASTYHLGVRKLEWVWKNFRTHHVYETQLGSVFGYLGGAILRRVQSEHLPQRPASILNNQPLRRLVRNTMDFARLDRNIQRGHLRAMSVTASSYTTRESIHFFQGHPDISPWQRAHRRGVREMLNEEHLMASSAIPLLFPAVKLGAEYFGDGAIHQLSPLSTPIHLGAKKILIIGVEGRRSRESLQTDSHQPNMAGIAGHLLDTVFADSLHMDLERLNRVNSTLQLLTDKQRRATKLDFIDCMVINPSRPIEEMANRHYHLLPAGIRRLFALMGVHNNKDASLLSYLLFETSFCRELIELGYQDGMARKEELRAFLAI